MSLNHWVDMKYKIGGLSGALLLAASVIFFAANETTYQVPGDYTTIIAAVSAMPSEGGTILVASGAYPLVSVTTNNIRIECAGMCVSKGFSLYGSNNGVIGFDIIGAKQAGVYLFGTGHLVEGNDISGTTGDGDGIRAFGSGHTIRGNYIHTPSASVGAHIDCLQTWDETNSTVYVSISNFIFEDNVCYQFGSITAGVQLEGNVHHGVIRNNVITSLAGIRGYLEIGYGTRAPHDLTIEHNVFIGGLSYAASLAPVGVTFSGAANIAFRNNIILDQPKYTINITGSNNIVSYNLAYNSNGAMPPLPNVPLVSSIWGVNPKLTSDYRPLVGSPVIGAASDGGDIGLASAQAITPTDTVTPSATFTPVFATPTPTLIWQNYRCQFLTDNFICEKIP